MQSEDRCEELKLKGTDLSAAQPLYSFLGPFIRGQGLLWEKKSNANNASLVSGAYL